VIDQEQEPDPGI